MSILKKLYESVKEKKGIYLEHQEIIMVLSLIETKLSVGHNSVVIKSYPAEMAQLLENKANLYDKLVNQTPGEKK